MNINERYAEYALPTDYSLMDDNEKLVSEVIDVIYADFASRNCNNCEHWCSIDNRCYKIMIDGVHTITSCSEFKGK